MIAMGIKERFGLKRDHILLDPISDSEFYAPRSDINVNKLIEVLRVDLEAGLTPKMVFWGTYGGGKTHTLGNVQKSLQKLAPVHCVYIRCPTLSEKDKFTEFYRTTFNDGLGEKFTIDLLWELCDQLIKSYGLRDERVWSEMRSILGDEELTKATLHLSDRSFDPSDLWRWISGVKMSSSDLKRLGVTMSISDAEPLRQARLIETMGRLLYHLKKKKLVLAYDEMERIKDLREDAALTFKTAFTHLFDPEQKYVSIFCAFSAESTRDIPELMKGPVIDRIGGESSEAVIEIHGLDPGDVENFVAAVLDYLRDPNADLDGMVKKAKKETSETVTKSLFPFTKEAIRELTGRANLTPRNIMFSLTRAMSRANIHNKNVVTSEFIR
jgi:hypothetical protein